LLYQLLQELAKEGYSCWLQEHCLKIWRRKEPTLGFTVGKDNEGMSRSFAQALKNNKALQIRQYAAPTSD